MPESDRFDVFISYARKDAGDWVKVLAENLHRLGFNVFFDEWEIGPGDVLVHELDRGILHSTAGVLVVTPAALENHWVQAEYAAMMSRAIKGQQTLIPILLIDAEMPPLLASHLWVDFRHADGPEYETRIEQLADRLRGRRPGRPKRGEALAPPPGSGFKAVGPLRRTLVISQEEVRLEGGEAPAKGAPEGLDRSAETKFWNLSRARQRATSGQVIRDASRAGKQPADAEIQRALLDIGAVLTRAFLPEPVEAALRSDLDKAKARGSSLVLALRIEDPLGVLPWETLRAPGAATGEPGEPGRPLALHPNVEIYRHRDLGAAPVVQVPRPLKILVAIGSPEKQNEDGELLDYEAELARILDAVEAPQRKHDAQVQILHRGTVEAIHDALRRDRFHILYISCHAGPGVLILEDAEGKEDRVGVKRLWEEGFPADRQPPVVVLAGCATALAGRAASESDDEETDVEETDGSTRPDQADETVEPVEAASELPALAEGLLAQGIPAVVAMQAPVGDRYATALAGEIFETLGTSEEPSILSALSAARRQIEIERTRQEAVHEMPEWATPSLYLRGQPLRLFDPDGPESKLEEVEAPRLDAGVIVRRVGEFVGRRREERLSLRALRDPDLAGLLIRGLGGVGKSTLAAQALHRIGEEQDRLVLSVAGKTSADDILEVIGKFFFSQAMAAGLPENHPQRQVAQVLRNPQMDWGDRFDVLAQAVLPQAGLVFLLDNFEDNLRPSDGGFDFQDPDLAELLARWAGSPGASRLVITCRYPVALPEGRENRIRDIHLGPLSLAETRKLMLRLPGLSALDPEEKQRAHAEVGGHPRALEYLDALLRGEARFPDVGERLRKVLREQEGIEHPEQWTKGVAGDFHRALAETITVAAGDVLLRDLLSGFGEDSLARRLLLGTSVYRVPVDDTALHWQVGEVQEEDPQVAARVADWRRRMEEARKEGKEPTPGTLGYSASEWQALQADFASWQRPPLAIPEEFESARVGLLGLGLLSPVPRGDDRTFWSVHRWTAQALAQIFEEAEVRMAHERAARFWRFRVERVPQDRQQDMEQLLEARHHHHQAGDLEEAITVTEAVCDQFDTWGAYRRVERLCREVLEWIPELTKRRAGFLHQLGLVAQKRGSYDEALEWYRKSLEIYEELGSRVGMASSYHQLGMVAEDRGAYEKALEWYHKSLAIEEELGNRAGMASSYHQLGMVAQKCDSYGRALEWYRKALAIKEELGNRAGMANSYHQLGTVAYLGGSYDEALEWYRNALAIREELVDRAGIASSYHQLGLVAEERRSYDEALAWYRKSLAIEEELGNRAGMASSFSQLGALATNRGEPAGAVPLNLRGLAIRLEIGSPEARIDLHWLGRQREALGRDRFLALVTEHVGEDGAARVLEMMAQYEKAVSEAAEE